MFLDFGGHISPDTKSKLGGNTSSERLGIFFIPSWHEEVAENIPSWQEEFVGLPH
jgi:hypothetical protein